MYFDSGSYWFYIEIKKGFLLSPLYKHLKGIFAYRAPDCRKPAMDKQVFFKINFFLKYALLTL